MSDHNFNALGGDLCQIIDESLSQNEADDVNNSVHPVPARHSTDQAAFISPPPRKRPRPKKGHVHLKSNIGKKTVDELAADYDKYLKEEAVHDLCFSETALRQNPILR